MLKASESGQAAVETALLLPLVLFVLLGTLQLFMMLQARLLAQLAVFEAVRIGSVTHGDCEPMTDVAVATMLPTIEHTDSAGRLAAAFERRRNNRYEETYDGHDGQIVELFRESPLRGSIESPEREEEGYDQPSPDITKVLSVRMIFWYQMQIPFANWVMSRMFLARNRLKDYSAVNPLLAAEKNAAWPDNGEAEGYLTNESERWPGGAVGQNMLRWSDRGDYLLPIRVSATMRMMQPPMRVYFPAQECPL